MNEENKDFKTISEWADENYLFYKTSKGLTSYFARCKNTSNFYLLDYGIGDRRCEEIPYSEYLDMDLNQTLVEISAKEVDEVLCKDFFAFINE